MRVAAYMKKYRVKNKTILKLRRKKFWQKHRKRILAHRKSTYPQKREKIIAAVKIYAANNKAKIAVRSNRYAKNRKLVDLNFRLRTNLRARLLIAILNGQRGGSAIRDLGCSIPELRKHLESKFAEGMNWDNYGLSGWHIDHIKALSLFDLSKKSHIRKACHYTNLQPLWAKDNIKKGNK